MPRVFSLFNPIYDFPEPSGATHRYMIASVPRSGSTLFCASLWAAGGLGRPLEYLNGSMNREAVSRLGGGDLSAYWDKVQDARADHNGLFGFKLFVEHLFTLEKFQPALVSRVYADSVILFTREDKEAQAVSYHRAIGSGAWTYDAENTKPVRYDYTRILAQERSIIYQERLWRKIIPMMTDRVLNVSYEELLRDSDGTVERVRGFLDPQGKTHAFQPVALANVVERQGDEQSLEWLERYRREKTELGVTTLEAGPSGESPKFINEHSRALRS